jgi:hypothetical protein
MADILKMQRSGTAETLLANAAEYAHDMDFLLIVFVDKGGTVNTEWSKIPDRLRALGAIEMLRQAILES